MYYILFGLFATATIAAIYFLSREDYGSKKPVKPYTEQEDTFGALAKYDEKEFTPTKTSDLFMVCDQNNETCFNQ